MTPSSTTETNAAAVAALLQAAAAGRQQTAPQSQEQGQQQQQQQQQEQPVENIPILPDNSSVYRALAQELLRQRQTEQSQRPPSSTSQQQQQAIPVLPSIPAGAQAQGGVGGTPTSSSVQPSALVETLRALVESNQHREPSAPSTDTNHHPGPTRQGADLVQHILQQSSYYHQKQQQQLQSQEGGRSSSSGRQGLELPEAFGRSSTPAASATASSSSGAASLRGSNLSQYPPAVQALIAALGTSGAGTSANPLPPPPPAAPPPSQHQQQGSNHNLLESILNPRGQPPQAAAAAKLSDPSVQALLAALVMAAGGANPAQQPQAAATAQQDPASLLANLLTNSTRGQQPYAHPQAGTLAAAFTSSATATSAAGAGQFGYNNLYNPQAAAQIYHPGIPPLAPPLAATNIVAAHQHHLHHVGAGGGSGSRVSSRHEAFPEKLMRMLEEIERADKDDIISFCIDGNGFEIHRPDAFEEEIIPQYFRHNRISSFGRQLSQYGFKKTTKGPGRQLLS